MNRVGARPTAPRRICNPCRRMGDDGDDRTGCAACPAWIRVVGHSKLEAVRKLFADLG